MVKINDIIQAQGERKILSISPQSSVGDALELIVKERIGALPVFEGEDNLVGIITERDILWRMHKEGQDALQRQVSDVMTAKVIVGVLDDDIEVAETFMTVNRFRHLPVMDGSKLVGMISIGDLVKSQIKNLKVQNRYLKDYITGKYPG
ncbi:MAG: CBS domain-containing protein [candidate division Zixibacteria bacterium]|nr:CBS domain-containing protein [candidate division Zixibacteria bacterium]